MRLTKEDKAIAVNVITGFLGSGKTTILRQILSDKSYGDTMVLINEFGEVGLDQVLVTEITSNIVLLNSGCLCCTLRGELRDALVELLSQRLQGIIPPFKRIIIETTGLAKPMLIVSTVFADPLISKHYTIGSIATVVDSFHAESCVDSSPEWMEQVTAADSLILTKTDLVSTEKQEDLIDLLNSINPSAPVQLAVDLNYDDLFAEKDEISLKEKKNRLTFRYEKTKNDPNEPVTHSHNLSVNTLHICQKEAIEWEAFGVWLSMLLHAHGNDILRVKGIANIKGNNGPLVIQGVQHVVYPPEHLPSWEGLAVSTDLVFITRNLCTKQIKRSFDAFVMKFF